MMGRALLKTRSLALVAAALAVGSAALSVALTVVALRAPRMVLVPGVQEREVRIAGEVPDSAVRHFGIHYLYHFEDYTPATVEARSNYVLQFIAPEHQESAWKALSERATYVVRAKEASQLLLPLPAECEVEHLPEGTLRFTARAARTIYVAGEAKSEEKIRYVLELRPILPSIENPYGFLVLSQSIKSEEKKERGSR